MPANQSVIPAAVPDKSASDMGSGVGANAWGGSAVAILVLAIVALVSYLTGGSMGEAWDGVTRWSPVALLLGAIVFAVATVIRAFRDEVGLLVGAWAERRASAELDAARIYIVELEQELEELRSTGVVSSRSAIHTTAVAIIRRHFAGQGISRTECMRDLHCTRPDWEQARATMRDAGVLDDSYNIVAKSAGEAEALLLAHLRRSGHYVRAADGSFTKA